MDALGAIELLGYDDRMSVKSALSASLAKSEMERKIFDLCFESFFSQNALINNHGSDGVSPRKVPDPDILAQAAPLSGMLLSDDWAGIAVAMQMAFETIDVASLRFFTQKGQNIAKILQRLNFEDIARDVQRMRQEGSVGSAESAAALEETANGLYNFIKHYVQRQLALHVPSTDEEYYSHLKLSEIDERDYRRMQPIIARMIKQLNSLYARRRNAAKAGALDFKKTLRVNLANHGILFDTRWRKKKPDRADVIAICDISRSVRSVTRFFLLFLYSLTEIVSKIKTFVFCSNLVEASHIFETYPLEEAVSRIETGSGLPILMGLTDYGRAFSEFKELHLSGISRKTTVFIIGDARNNYDNPGADILGLIRLRCRKIVWLNPEDPRFWQTGDSVMKSYLPYCHVARECNTLDHLLKVSALLCRVAR
jgi:hypothetical protein